MSEKILFVFLRTNKIITRKMGQNKARLLAYLSQSFAQLSQAQNPWNNPNRGLCLFVSKI